MGRRGVECRVGSGVGSGDHRIVVSFANKVNVPTAGVSGIFTGGSFGVNGNVVTVDLQGVANAQTLTVILDNVTDGVNVGTVVIPMGVLLGDTTANGFVNSADVSQTQSQSGQPLTGSNFREDVTANGFINSADVSLVQSKSGTSLSLTSINRSAAKPNHKTNIKKRAVLDNNTF